jgi:hypothetical protein
MLAGKPDAGNPHVRFDEGEQRVWRKPPVALYSTDLGGSNLHARGAAADGVERLLVWSLDHVFELWSACRHFFH